MPAQPPGGDARPREPRFPSAVAAKDPSREPDGRISSANPGEGDAAIRGSAAMGACLRAGA